VLETTANPYVISMGPQDSATRRLNVAQTLNPVGAVAGILLSRHFILSELSEAGAAERAGMSTDALNALQHRELDAISGTYMLIGVILLALLATIAFIKMPGEKEHSSPLDIKSTIRRLWGNRRYRYGVIAQFFYVGVQTGVWSFTIRLTMAQLNVLEKDASMVFLYSILAFTLFRFLFTWLMAYIKPVRLLAVASVMAIAATSVVIFSTGPAAIVALVAISACMSLMFPTIYGIALNGIGGDSAKIAASGLIMAILGGALLTPLQALVSDVCGISYSFAVPLLCFAVVLAYAAGIIMRTAKARSERGCGISNP